MLYIDTDAAGEQTPTSTRLHHKYRFFFSVRRFFLSAWNCLRSKVCADGTWLQTTVTKIERSLVRNKWIFINNNRISRFWDALSTYCEHIKTRIFLWDFADNRMSNTALKIRCSPRNKKNWACLSTYCMPAQLLEHGRVKICVYSFGISFYSCWNFNLRRVPFVFIFTLLLAVSFHFHFARRLLFLFDVGIRRIKRSHSHLKSHTIASRIAYSCDLRSSLIRSRDSIHSTKW